MQQLSLFTQEEKDRQFYHKNRRSNECLCNREKKTGHAFCFKCFYLLPEDLRADLCRPVGSTYIDAFEDAAEALKPYWDERNI